MKKKRTLRQEWQAERCWQVPGNLKYASSLLRHIALLPSTKSKETSLIFEALDKLNKVLSIIPLNMETSYILYKERMEIKEKKENEKIRC